MRGSIAIGVICGIAAWLGACDAGSGVSLSDVRSDLAADESADAADIGADVADAADLPMDTASDGSPDGSPDVADAPVSPDLPDATDSGPDLPPFTPGGCGLAPYSWLPRDQVGTVVFWEEDPQWMLPSEALDSLLSQVGFTAFTPLPYGSRVFYVRYRTQDKGVVHEATTTVGVPQPKDGSAGVYPTVLWLHGTTGFSDSCAPSRDLEGPAGAALMAALGFIGVAPDYLGMNGFGEPSDMPHPYLIGEPTAIACLDAARAAFSLLDDDGIGDEPGRPDGRVVPWGGSQGGHAALWVDRLAGLYAPEFEVPATVAIIPPADLSGEGSVAMSTLIPGTENFAAYLVAAMRWYGNPASMAGVLTDTEPAHFATQVPQIMDTKCGSGGAFDDLTSLDQLFEPAFLADLAQQGVDGLDPWSCYFRENSLTTTSWPRVGDGAVMFILSEKDELENIPVERAAFSRMCQEQGYRMQFLECAGARHAEGGAWSLPEQRAWLMDRLAGTPMDPSKVCQLSDPVRCSAEPEE